MRLNHYPYNISCSLLMVLAVLIVLSGLVGCKKESGQQAMRPASVQEVGIVTIIPQTVELDSKLPGRTSAYLEAEIRPQVDGIILKRHFREGSDIRAGQLLYQIDPDPFQAALDSARASLGRAEANLPSIRSRADRYRELVVEKAVSQQDYDDAAAALNQALAEIKYWEAEVKSARINLKYTRITAPISGRIGRSSVTDGAMVTAYQPQALATIQQLDPIYVDVTQSSAELLRLNRRLEAGRLSTSEEKMSNVRIIMEDGISYPLEGTLQFRDITVNPETGSYILRIVVSNPEFMLLPGMFVRAVIHEGIAHGAILAPQQGVSRTPKGEPMALLVDENNIVQQRILTVDRTIGDQWLVTDGLSGGDRVIIEGMLKVRPGDTVKPVPLDNPRLSESSSGTHFSSAESK